MPALPVTATAASILGLLYIVLSIRVVMARGSQRASLGDGSGALIAAGQEHTVPLLVAARTHANFAEYVPFCLVLLGLVEMQGSARWVTVTLATLLVAARLLHPLGMGRKIPNPFRAAGLVLTLFMILGASVAILAHLARH
jgi:uncharacterized membrane protein YecN with MAPEG domain